MNDDDQSVFHFFILLLFVFNKLHLSSLKEEGFLPSEAMTGKNSEIPRVRQVSNVRKHRSRKIM